MALRSSSVCTVGVEPVLGGALCDAAVQGRGEGRGTTELSKGVDLGPLCIPSVLYTKSNLVPLTVVKKSLKIQFFSMAVFMTLKFITF